MDSERPAAAPHPTGDARVDEAIAGLASLRELPLDEHPPVLEAVHDSLREILGELGDPGRPSRPGEPGRPGQQAELGTFTGGRSGTGGPSDTGGYGGTGGHGGADQRR